MTGVQRTEIPEVEARNELWQPEWTMGTQRRSDSRPHAISRRALLLSAPTALLGFTAWRGWAADAASAKPERSPFVEPPADLLACVHPHVRYTRTALPDNQNAFPLLLEAKESYPAFAEIVNHAPSLEEERQADMPLTGVYDRVEQGGRFAAGQSGEQMRQWVAGRRRIWELTDRAIERGKCQFPEDIWQWYARRENAKSKRVRWTSWLGTGSFSETISQLRLIRARMLLADGDRKGAVAEICQVLRLGKLVAEADGLAADCAAGHCLQISALRHIQTIARHQLLDDSWLVKLLAELPGYWPSLESLRRVYQVEFCYRVLPDLSHYPAAPLDALVDVLLTRRIGIPESAAAREAHKVDKNAFDMVRRGLLTILRGHSAPLDKADTVRVWSRLLAAQMADLDKPYFRRQRDLGKGVRNEVAPWPQCLDVRKIALSVFNFESLKPAKATDTELAAARQALAKVSNPLGKHLAIVDIDVNSLRKSLEELRAWYTATKTVLAVCRFRSKYGWLPQSLDALEQEKLLDSVPLDPFSGQPLRYSRERGLLWSVGVDEKNGDGDWDFDAEYPYGNDLVWKLPLARKSTRPRRRPWKRRRHKADGGR